MKVAIVSTGSVIDVFPPKGGGIEVLEYGLLEALKKRGNSVQLFCSKSSLKNSVEIGSHKIKNQRIHSVLSMLNCYNKRKMLESEVIHCSYPLTALPFLGLKPLVYTEHNWYNLKEAEAHRTAFTPIFDFAQSRVYKKADRIIAISSEMKKILEEKVERLCGKEGKRKVVFIPNYIDTSRFVPKKKIPSRILFVGRLAKEKGIDLLLHALEGQKNYELRIAGEGKERENLERIAKEKKINAKFLGFVSHEELPKEFASAGIFVLPSYFEVMPVVVLEAMSAECAVIASDAFGIRDEIEDKKSGMIFEKGNTEQLKEKLAFLLKNPTFAGRLGKEARRKALKEFDSQIVAEKIENLYREVLEEKEK